MGWKGVNYELGPGRNLSGLSLIDSFYRYTGKNLIGFDLTNTKNLTVLGRRRDLPEALVIWLLL